MPATTDALVMAPSRLGRIELIIHDARSSEPASVEHSPMPLDAPIGLTLRDWFAGQALSGYIVKGGGNSVEHITTMSYRFAGAMVRARDRSPAQN